MSAEILDRSRAAAAGSAARGGPPPADAVHCAVVLPRGGRRNLSVLVASLLDHASRPLRLWVLARPGTEAVQRSLAERFPDLSFGWVPIGGLAKGLRTPAGTPQRAASVIRLLLPEVLPDVERAVLLPLPALATGDVAELAALDLGSAVLAAPTRPGAGASGFGVIHAAARRLGDRTEAAATLRRMAHARHPFDFDAFAADVLVLDLERMREQGFTAEALALVQAFGLDDLDALHYLAGPRRATVPARWAWVPTRMPPAGPGLIHWADPVKPWQARLTPERERWARYAAGFTPGERVSRSAPSAV